LEGVKNDLAAHGPNPALALRARKLLVDWFKNHIANTDKAFATYLFEQKHPAAGTV
jgi:hemerythrin